MAHFARTIEAEQFDAEQWRPFGWVPLADTDPHDGESMLFFEWGDAHLNLIGHDAGEVRKVVALALLAVELQRAVRDLAVAVEHEAPVADHHLSVTSFAPRALPCVVCRPSAV